MTSDAARAISIVTYGNAFLAQNYDLALLKETHYFKETHLEFHCQQKRFLQKPVWKLYSSDIIDWLSKLKQEGCIKLRMVFSHDGSMGPDFQLAGFVNAGGFYVVETVFNSYSDFWIGRTRQEKTEEPKGEFWVHAYYKTAARKASKPDAHYNLDEIKQQLSDKILEVIQFCITHKLDYWKGKYEDALKQLQLPEKAIANKYLKGVLPNIDIDLRVYQLANAGIAAWNFGGMGSWNDISFDDKTVRKEFDKVSSELFDALTQCFCIIANCSK